MNDFTRAKPLQAALASGAAFTLGGLLPVIVALISPLKYMGYLQYISALFFLTILESISARAADRVFSGQSSE